MKKTLIGKSWLIAASILAWGMTPLKAAPSANETVIPFELQGHVIVVKCRINDAQKEYNFIVDTGGLTFIDKTLADELKLKQQGLQAKIDRLVIGGYAVDNLFVATGFPFQMQRATSGISLQGMIGSDFLEDFLVTFDYEKRRLILSSAPESLAAEKKEGHDNGYLLPFKSLPLNHAPMISCKLNGTIDCEAMIDTGLPFPLALPLNFLEKTGALVSPETIKAKGVMVKWPMTQSTDNYLSRVKSLEAGNLELRDLPAVYAELPAMLSAALLGKGFLSQFLVKINYPKHEILLVPRPGNPIPENLFSVGLSLAQEGDDRVVVRGVWEKSPAAQAGLEVGDRIVAFNSKKLTFASHLEFYLLLQDDKVKSVEVVIQKSDGEKKVILQKRNLLQPASS